MEILLFQNIKPCIFKTVAKIRSIDLSLNRRSRYRRQAQDVDDKNRSKKTNAIFHSNDVNAISKEIQTQIMIFFDHDDIMTNY